MYDNANIYNANKIFIKAGEFYGPPYGMSCTGINEIYLWFSINVIMCHSDVLNTEKMAT
jgi:hypothetical protein